MPLSKVEIFDNITILYLIKVHARLEINFVPRKKDDRPLGYMSYLLKFGHNKNDDRARGKLLNLVKFGQCQSLKKEQFVLNSLLSLQQN